MANIVVLNPLVENPVIDIVLVHGLNPLGRKNHARETWTTKGYCWPEELCKTVELSTRNLGVNARILLFDYNSAVFSNASSASLCDHANSLLSALNSEREEQDSHHRPLIFVAHSLGGLLVKQALIKAVNHVHYICIKRSTYGLIFFATPHRGASSADVGNLIANVGSAVTGNSKNSLLDQLKKKSFLNYLTIDMFSQQSNDYEILSYFETKKTAVKVKNRRILPTTISIYIVDKQSETLGIAREEPLDMNRNHSEICKFDGEVDKTYTTFLKKLRSMAGRAQGYRNRIQCRHDANGISELVQKYSPIVYTSSAPGAIPIHATLPKRHRPHINVPPNPATLFAGREDLSDRIRQQLLQDDQSKKCRLALHGPGGIGKSELGLQVVQDLDKFEFILWICASTIETYEEDILNCALRLKDEYRRITSISGNTSSSSHQQIYFAEPSRSPDGKSLELWLQSEEAHSHKILLVLDDLDGVDVSVRKRIRRYLITNVVDFIITTRDPLLAAKGGDWEATSIEVPQLEELAAINLLGYLMQEDSNKAREELPTAPQELYAPETDALMPPTVVNPSIHTHPSSERDAVTGAADIADPAVIMSAFVNNLERRPAAIVIGWGFARAHYLARPAYKCLQQTLHDWAPEDLIIHRWDSMTYPYTLHKAFQLSCARLLRNTSIGESSVNNGQCRLVLYVLSTSSSSVFGDDELRDLCNYFQSFIDFLGCHSTVSDAESFVSWRKHSVADDLVSLTKMSRLGACFTELIKVSLLCRDDNGLITLDTLTKVCTLRLSQSSSDPGLLSAEILAYLHQHPVPLGISKKGKGRAGS